ncbi:MAG: hypothetical protein ACKPJO_03015 [Dolichospermum sp.]
MLQNLFGGLAPIDKTELTGVGFDPRRVGLMGNHIARIKSKSQLPTEISSNQLLKSAKEAGEVEAELELAKDIMTHEQATVSKLEQLDDVNLNHSKFMMRVDLGRRKAQAMHGREVSKYGLNAAETQVNLNGYQQIYDVQAREIFG